MKSTFLAFLLAAAPMALAIEPTTPLVSGPEATVDATDFEAQMLRIPEEMRRETRANLDRVATMTDAIFVNRVLAREAKRQGLLDDPLVARRGEQILEAYQARVYLDKFEKSVQAPSAEARARELYLADKARFQEPERYELEHVLVNLWGRTREMAIERVREAKSKLEAGAELAAVVRDYGTDINARTPRPSGKLGIVAAKDLDSAIGNVLPKLAVGQWSDPIETRAGFHLVRVVSKVPGREIPFNDVKVGLVDEERVKLVKRAVDEKIQQIRNAPGVKIDKAALEALVQPVTREELEKLQREARPAAERDTTRPR